MVRFAIIRVEVCDETTEKTVDVAIAQKETLYR
jgi:hypothetical protein